MPRSSGRARFAPGRPALALGRPALRGVAVPLRRRPSRTVDMGAPRAGGLVLYLNGDGVADLSAVNGSGAVTAYLVTNLSSATGSATAQPSQPLISANHHWALADASSGPVGTAADLVGSTNLTGSGNAVWNTGDVFSPDVSLHQIAVGRSGRARRARPRHTFSSAGSALSTNGGSAT